MNCRCSTTDMVPFEDFLPYILPSVGEVPDQIAAHMAREATIEYAQQTKELKATFTLDAQAGVQHYRLCAPDNYSIEALDYVDNGCRPLAANREVYGFPGGTFTFDRPDTIILGCAPRYSEERAIEVRAIMIPGQDSCYVDRMVYDRHAELISHGARMRIYRMLAEEWFNPTAAREEERLWRDGLRWARVKSLKGGSTQPQVLRARRVV